MGDELSCVNCGYTTDETEFRDIFKTGGVPVGIQWQCPECRIWSEKITEVLEPP